MRWDSAANANALRLGRCESALPTASLAGGGCAGSWFIAAGSTMASGSAGSAPIARARSCLASSTRASCPSRLISSLSRLERAAYTSTVCMPAQLRWSYQKASTAPVELTDTHGIT